MRDRYPGGFYITPQFEEHRAEIAKNALVGTADYFSDLDRTNTELTAEEFRGYAQRRFNDLPEMQALVDGVAVMWNTEAFLERHSHRLLFLDDGNISYTRETFDDDPQKIPSPPVKLDGLEQITTDNEAVVGLIYTSNLLVRAPGDPS